MPRGRRLPVIDYSAVINEEPSKFEIGNVRPITQEQHIMPRTSAKGPAKRRTPANETPRQKFVRLIALRTEGLLDGFNNLRKLANKESYPYGEADIAAIRRLVYEQAELTEKSFRSGREVPGGLHLPVDDWEK